MGTLAIFFVVVAIAKSYFLGPTNVQQAGRTVSFRELIHHPVSLGITSKLTAEGRSQFSAALKAANHDNVLDSTVINEEFFEADVFVFILSDWSEADILPSRDVFSAFYDEVRLLKQNDVKRMYQLASQNGSPKLLVFYRSNFDKDSDLLCLAKDIVEEISSDDVAEKASNYSCSS